jgi:hypothetical protein
MKNDVKMIKIGSKVMWRGGWGSDPPEEAVVTEIEITDGESKYGEVATSVPFDNRETASFILSNGHWCYGNQIDEVLN